MSVYPPLTITAVRTLVDPIETSWRIPRTTGLSGSGLGFGWGVVATCLGALTGPDIGLVLLAVVAVSVGAVTTVPGAVLGAAQCWALYTGFLDNQLGVLRMDDNSEFALHLLLSVGFAASVVALLIRALATGPEPRAGTVAHVRRDGGNPAVWLGSPGR